MNLRIRLKFAESPRYQTIRMGYCLRQHHKTLLMGSDLNQKTAKLSEGTAALKQGASEHAKILILVHEVNSNSGLNAMYWQYLSLRRVSFFVFVSFFVTQQQIAHAKTYFYYDDDGTPVFSQTPPPDSRESKTIKPPPPPAEPNKAQQQLQRQQQHFLDRKEDREMAKEKAAAEKANVVARKKNCEAARSNLSKYQLGGSRLYLDKKSGEYKRYSTEQLADLKKQQQQTIKDNCD